MKLEDHKLIVFTSEDLKAILTSYLVSKGDLDTDDYPNPPVITVSEMADKAITMEFRSGVREENHEN